VMLPLLTLALANLRPDLNLTSDLLLFLVGVVAVALVGGVYPSLVAALAASLLLNYYFTPPIHRFTIDQRDNVIALVAFLLVAAVVSWVVDLAARRTSQAARASAESQTLATLAGSILRGDNALTALLDRLREALSLSAVTLLERDSAASDRWTVVATVGDHPSASPDDGDAHAFAGEVLALVVRGHPAHAQDQRLLGVFVAQAATVLERLQLTEAAAAAEPIAEADRMRTALLTAVSHDLRSPLSSATAAVDSLSSTDVAWTGEERAELLATARESLLQLARLVENLLDMSRLQAGALSVFPVSVGLDEIVPVVLDAAGPEASAVDIDLPESLPDVIADPALLERVIANIVANATRFSPPNSPPQLSASAHGEWVELRIIDRGPGVPPEDKVGMFTPFQRLGDTDNTTGVGLGLALARGLVEAMGGELVPEDTPGGGFTMVVRLRQAPTTADKAQVAELDLS
jgi:two-component system, OmpR family, sensor histidine kinase KdpD